MVFHVLVTAYAVIVSFVLSTAGRRRREARPLGRAVQTAGQLAYGTSVTFALLCMGWACMIYLGATPAPALS